MPGDCGNGARAVPGADPVSRADRDADRRGGALPAAHVRPRERGGIRRGVPHGGGADVDAAITLEDLATLLQRRGVRVDQQAPYFSRVPEERRRHWSTAGGLPLELLTEETQASRRVRKGRGVGSLEGVARAGAGDRIEPGVGDILPGEGCLD